MEGLNKNIEILERYIHSKAFEEYIDVIFHYPEEDWEEIEKEPRKQKRGKHSKDVDMQATETKSECITLEI